ncbi:MAG TPA: PVC-type heme-binding CxxCH protein [Verrucomicrobiae bacterium]
MLSVRVALVRGFLFLLAGGFCTFAGELLTPSSFSPPKVAEASNEGELTMKRFELPAGFKVELIAAEPHLANPVAFDIDHQGRFWVSETFRLHAGVTDIRGKNSWLDEDLASRTVEDRISMMKRHEGENFAKYELNSDRLKLLLDTNGDGKVDKSTVFADGFNTAADGIASGVLARDGKVWFANIPNLWSFTDSNGDGVAEERKSLHYGFGVRVGFLGHDLHGLIMGPDGKLYFTIGDRGSNIKVDGKTVGNPDTGCVFRCNPDGSELEVFAYGLRNPQELAFDQYGNLFTGDNNSDGGDRARIVHLVEGADSGWRIGWQFLERPNARGAWNSEKMWHPQNDEQPAYIIPPITNLTDGPSGFAFNPGTGLPEKYRNNFFLVDFHGGKGSGVYAFTLKPKGAGFTMAAAEKFVWETLPTDVAFGLDGGLYVLDWVQGWGMTGKGRIYRVFHSETDQQKIVAETKKLLSEGVKERSNRELERLLAHVDMRVRQEAQFELVKRGAKGANVLAAAARKSDSQLARIHAIWGLTQLARGAVGEERDELVKQIIGLAKDKDAEVRAQVAKAIGDAKISGAVAQVKALLVDDSARVRMFAAISAGKLGNKAFAPEVFKLLAENADRDPQLRHAGAFALAGINEMEVIRAAAENTSDAVRMGALLALRRMERTDVAFFLKDKNSKIALEAARAINDLPISGAMRELAAVAESSNLGSLSVPMQRRVLNANYRYGTKETAKVLAAIATNEQFSEEIRADALRDLGEWERPSGRDRITGMWRPVVGPRSAEHAIEAIEPQIVKLISSESQNVRIAAANAAGALKIGAAGDALLAAVKSDAPSRARVEALRALGAMNDERLADAVQAASNDQSEQMRREALKFQSLLKPAGALEQIDRALQGGSLGEKQSALSTLGSMKDPQAEKVLAAWMDRLNKGEVPAELHVDVLEAASKKETLDGQVQEYNARLSKDIELGRFRSALTGGSLEEGKRVFFERAEAGCVRCHKIQGQGSEGGLVGPELTKIGAQKDRKYLLESLVYPNRHIAEGFQSELVVMKDGSSVAGVVRGETDTELQVESAEDGSVKVKKSEIARREKTVSAMPEGLGGLLGMRDLRDLVEYLSSLK